MRAVRAVPRTGGRRVSMRAVLGDGSPGASERASERSAEQSRSRSRRLLRELRGWWSRAKRTTVDTTESWPRIQGRPVRQWQPFRLRGAWLQRRRRKESRSSAATGCARTNSRQQHSCAGHASIALCSVIIALEAAGCQHRLPHPRYFSRCRTSRLGLLLLNINSPCAATPPVCCAPPPKNMAVEP